MCVQSEVDVNSSVIRAGVVAGVLVLSGCAGGGSGVAVQPAANPTATPAVRVQPVSHPSTSPPKVAKKDPAPDSTGAESAFCTGVLKDSRPAVAALKKLVDHPDGSGLTAADFSDPRTRLQRREATAPKHLLGYLETQVRVLDQVLPDVTRVKHATKLANRFTDARMELVLDCEMAE